MSNDAFVLQKFYILSAIDKSGKRVYYDTDSHSGGYPYWSSFFRSIKIFESLESVPVLSPNDYMRNSVTRIEVLEVEVNAKVVNCEEMISEAKRKAMAEVAKIEQELERKIAALKDMK